MCLLAHSKIQYFWDVIVSLGVHFQCCVAAQCIHLQGQTVSPWLLHPEVQNIMFLWSTGLYTANHTPSYPGRLNSSVTPLGERHNMHQQCFFLGWEGFSFKWNFTVLLPYKEQSLLMLFCSANQEHHTHNYILFAVNVCLTDNVCCCIIWPKRNVLSFTQFVMFVLHLDSLLKAQPKPSIYSHIETFLAYLYRYGCLGNNFEVKTWQQLYQCNFGFHECKSAPWNRVRSSNQLNCMLWYVQRYCTMVLCMNPWKCSDNTTCFKLNILSI